MTSLNASRKRLATRFARIFKTLLCLTLTKTLFLFYSHNPPLLPHLQTSRGRSAPRAQPESVVNFLSIFAALEKQKDEWAKNEEIQVQEYASIIKAAYDGEVEEVRRNLQRNREAIHERTQGGRNALHAASTNGHLEIVQLLVETNLTINGEDATGITPLRMAVAGNHVEVTKYLLRQKAEPNIADHTGWTTLHSAALNDRADIIKCLKASGADVTKQTKRGYTALILASVKGHVGCVKELVEIKTGTTEMEAERRHYQLNMVDDAGFSALRCAALKGHAEIIKILLREGASPEKRSESEMVPLTLAAVEGHLSCIRELFPYTDKDDVSEAIAKAETRGHNNILRYIMVTSDDNTWSRLHNAGWKGETGIIRSLIADGRDIDEQSGEHGYTPLMLAIWQDHLECTKIIIEEGNANVNKADNNSCSPLHLAIELQNEEVVKVLLANGAQPDALNNEGKGALHDACCKGDPNAIKLLMNAGADVNIKSNHHSTPLLLAAEYGHLSCVGKLVAHGADPTERDIDGDSLVHVAALGGSLETLEYVLGIEGMSELVSSKNNAGHLPLHCAARKGNLDCVGLLLAQGSCPLMDEQDCDGKTPLHLAVEGGYSPVIEALIKAGADLNIQTNDGKTCLHLVVTLWGGPENPEKKVQTTNGFEPVSSRYLEYEPLTENEKLLIYLLDKGAIYTQFDASGNTPIHYTKSHRLWQLVVSRIPEEQRSNLLAALALESANIKRTVKKTIGPDGGEIDLDRYGVHMTIPAGALEDDQEIIMKLLDSPPEPAIQEGEMLASFGVRLNPCGLKFKKRVQIRLPHCAKLASTSPIKMVLYHSRDGKLTTVDMVSQDLRNTPAVVVQERDFVLHIGEFCDLCAVFKDGSSGKDVRCFISSRPCSGSKCHDLKITLANDIPNENSTTDGYKQICGHQCTLFYVQLNIADVLIALFDNISEKRTESVTEKQIFRRTQNDTYFSEIDTDSFTKLQVRLFHGERANITCSKPGELVREQPTPASSPLNIPDEVGQHHLIKASEIISHLKYNKLSNCLGCHSNYPGTILAKHLNDYQKALLEVLEDWKKRTSCNHRDKFIKALKDADVAGQIIDIFPDYQKSNVHDH